MMNFAMLTPYEECKERFSKYFGYTKKTYILSSICAGGIASFCALPFDNIKTKLQKMRQNPDGTYPYKGVAHCFFKVKDVFYLN